MNRTRRVWANEWRQGGPVITKIVMILCVALWMVEMLLSFVAPAGFQRFVGSGIFVPFTAVVRPWTWLTAMFLHAPNLMHVGFNMLALWSIGPLLERLMGHWRFLALYLISGLGGAAGLVVWARVTGAWFSSAYGASGAIFGLFAAMLVVHRATGGDMRTMLIWMAINFALPVLIPNVAWQAHVGGFLIGGALTWLLVDGVPALRRRSLAWRMWCYASIVTVVVLAVVVLCAPPFGIGL